MRLGINIDHVATLRNARGGRHPSPIRAAELVKQAGADILTIHLREDRRHIRDEDAAELISRQDTLLPVNLELAATKEMLSFALEHLPHAVCIVPEKREELTTEGGLNVAGQMPHLQTIVSILNDAGIRTSLFIDPDELQVAASAKVGAACIELHTGSYAENYQPTPSACGGGKGDAAEAEISLSLDAVEPPPSPLLKRRGEFLCPLERSEDDLNKLKNATKQALDLGLEVHAGHGLTYENTPDIAAIEGIKELNIGHFLVGEAVFIGLEAAITKMRGIM